jgi:hypothetical protein
VETVTLKDQEVDVVMNGPEKLGRGFIVYERNLYINVGRATLGRNLTVTIGRAACEASSATRNLRTKSALVLGTRKTTEILDRLAIRKTFRMQTDF